MLEGKKRIHLIGIGGAGMRAIANILIHKGFEVSGSDLSKSDIVKRFEALGATIHIGHKAENIEGAEVVVVSTAIPADNPELMAAREKGLLVLHRSDIVKYVLDFTEGIAVAGAHGKTSTTSMIGQIFEEALLDPTIIIGGEVDYLGGNSKLGKGKYSIVEADESDGSFLKLKPKMAVVTNIEDDHMDYYKTRENLIQAFEQFLENLPEKTGFAVVCGDNAILQVISEKGKRRCIRYGIDNENNEYKAVNIRYEEGLLKYDVLHEGEIEGTIQLQIPGKHNVLNSLAAYIIARKCGIDVETIVAGLAKFKGAKRRFDTKGFEKGVWVVDDYAHHPTEIKATLTAAKELEKHRVICVFQPHRYTRTHDLLAEFGKAFDDADILILTDIYAAGEAPIEGITGESIPQSVREHSQKEVVYIPNIDDVPAYLKGIVKENDLVLTMGAGSVNQYGPKLLALLKEA